MLHHKIILVKSEIISLWTFRTNKTECFEYEAVLFSANGTNFTTNPCVFTHDGSAGIKYQILAGPVFNNVYPLAGILAGILADTFNRKILLTVSLAFWSIATGVTGFATSYWMLVLFRVLLAIGLVFYYRVCSDEHHDVIFCCLFVCCP